MEFHEKSLELNITHELLNLADSWYWFLRDIPLWEYWKPDYRMPFLKYPRSTAGGFHITTEGKNDPTGNAGGGFDARIKTGRGNHLLFIQYKKGELVTKSPDPTSEFHTAPHEHFKFKINNTSTNQHFVLRELANGIGGAKGNAVVYAFPAIADMNDLEKNAGRLIRRTKFISIADIDRQADNKEKPFVKDQEHNFRVGQTNLSRCEINYYYYFYHGEDRTAQLITDIIAIKFYGNLSYFIQAIKNDSRKYYPDDTYLSQGLRYAFRQYIRFLFHYFEVSPFKFEMPFMTNTENYFTLEEFSDYANSSRDIEILTSVFEALSVYNNYINRIGNTPDSLLTSEIPVYSPKFLISSTGDEIKIPFSDETKREVVEEVNYLVI